jgi:TonB family protein
MDRLSKKCVITSAIVHGTLVLVLIVGPAFLGSDEPKFDPKEIIDFIPAITIDKSLTGGGNPNVVQVIPQPQPQPQPQPRPQPEIPQPKPERHPDPEPEKTKPPEKVVKPVEPTKPAPDPESLETHTKPKIDLTPKTRNSTRPQVTDTAAETRAREKAAREKAAKLESALNNIREGASGAVPIDELRGPGGGGLPYAGFKQALASTYMRAWLIPSEAADENGKAVATITLGRDGTVISARISKSSGNADLDKSVQRALDKVSFVAPFPESMKEAQKTFSLEFDPRAKRLMG